MPDKCVPDKKMDAQKSVVPKLPSTTVVNSIVLCPTTGEMESCIGYIPLCNIL